METDTKQEWLNSLKVGDTVLWATRKIAETWLRRDLNGDELWTIERITPKRTCFTLRCETRVEKVERYGLWDLKPVDADFAQRYQDDTLRLEAVRLAQEIESAFNRFNPVDFAEADLSILRGLIAVAPDLKPVLDWLKEHKR